MATENYLDPILQRNGKESSRFGTYLFNSTFVTVVATAITLLINAMAAFALSKYRFRGSTTVILMIIATLMIPQAIILVSALSVLAILSIIWRWNDVPSSVRGLSMVFQSYALYPHMSVRKNLTFGLENTRMTRAEMNERVESAAKLLQIDPLLDRRPGQLSGRQRQRVAIGRAIVREPVIFLFDEPLSNLDAELGNTMIYVTHDQIEAMTMADRIVVLRGGHIEQVGAPLDLYNIPANKFVAGFIGAPRMNFLAGQLEKGASQVVLDCGYFSAVSTTGGTDQPVTFGIRPEAIDVSLDGTGEVAARVKNFGQLGSITYIYTELETGEDLTVQLPKQVPSKRNLQLHVTFLPDAVHLFGQDERAIPRTRAA